MVHKCWVRPLNIPACHPLTTQAPFKNDRTQKGGVRVNGQPGSLALLPKGRDWAVQAYGNTVTQQKQRCLHLHHHRPFQPQAWLP